MLYYVYFTDGGVPETGLTPDWESIVTAENGTEKNGSGDPEIIETGGGWYVFEITYGTDPWDVTDEDLVGVIDGGNSLVDSDRYKPIAITKRGLSLGVISNNISDETESLTTDLLSTGLDNISVTEPTGVATTFREMIIQLWMRFFNKVNKSSTQIKTYKSDNALVTTQEHTDAGGITTVNKAS